MVADQLTPIKPVSLIRHGKQVVGSSSLPVGSICFLQVTGCLRPQVKNAFYTISIVFQVLFYVLGGGTAHIVFNARSYLTSMGQGN